MSNNDFLPEGYEQPSNTSYLKLQMGENRFRILSKPIVGWIDWKDKKPMRFAMNAKPVPVDPTKPVKHFWAFVVWNVKDKKIQILEITQVSIQTSISNLSKDADWGNPFAYDIKVTKTGSGMETEYAVTPCPKSELPDEGKKAFLAQKVDLNKLWTNDDPFVGQASAQTPPPAEQPKVQQPVVETPKGDPELNGPADDGSLPF